MAKVEGRVTLSWEEYERLCDLGVRITLMDMRPQGDVVLLSFDLDDTLLERALRQVGR